MPTPPATPQIQRYTTEPPTLTAAEVRAAIVALADLTDTVELVICDATTGQRLGNIALRLDAGVGEVSYWVAASARGQIREVTSFVGECWQHRLVRDCCAGEF
jgi:hypothetical protein